MAQAHSVRIPVRELVHQIAQKTTDVARVKAVFMPKASSSSSLPSYLIDSPLLYVEFFTAVANPSDDREGVGLYRVRRPPSTEDNCTVFRAVLPLTDVVQSVELIPVYETKLPGVEVSSENCLQAYDEYYVNSFSDKETFNVICSM